MARDPVEVEDCEGINTLGAVEFVEDVLGGEFLREDLYD